MGIILIEVGYEFKDGKFRKIEISKMEQYIRNQCIQKGVTPPKRDRPIDWCKFEFEDPDKKNELKNIAKKRNGKLISKTYFGETTPLKWYCNKHQNIWWAPPIDIRGKPSKPEGTWCPICGRERHKEAMKTIAKERIRDEKGRFIS